MVNKLSIIIADDHELLRYGLESTLKEIKGIRKIRHACNGWEVMDLLEQETCHLIFMDIRMPEMDGIKTTEEVKKKYPDICVLALSALDDKDSINRMIKAGADGYLLKNTGIKEISLSINSVMNGKRFFTQEVADVLIEKVTAKKSSGPKENLNQREIEILKLICLQHSNKEIAEMLSLSGRTIESYRANLLEKTLAKNTAGLVLYAIENKIIIPH